MNRTATLLLLLATAATGRAQFPGQNPNQGQTPGQQYPQQSMPGTAGVAMPLNYRPPLSPYLNLLRGGDPAINYYYAVRPALMNGVSPFGSMTGPRGFSQLRNGFLPAAGNPTQDPVEAPQGGEIVPSLPSAGNPVSYGGLTRYGAGMSPRQGAFGNQAPRRTSLPGR